MTTKQAKLQSYVRDIEGKEVMVIGDIMYDRFIYGSVDRISPESPVPVLSVKREESMLGGAGNVVGNLGGLNAIPYVISVIGDDYEGQIVKANVEKAGGETGGLIVTKDRPTIIKTRFLASNQQLLRSDNEKTHPITAQQEEEALDLVRKKIGDVGAVIISDYGKGMLTPRLIEEIISIANHNNIPVLVDPKGNDYSRYKGASVVTPNRKELSEATNGMATDSDAQIEIATKHLLAISGIKAVVATRSQDGMTVHESGGDHLHMPTKAIEVFDVSGAGDTVIATIAAALAANINLKDAAALANIAGGIVVAKVGTAIIRTADMLSQIDEMGDIKYDDVNRLYHAPCLEWERAAEQVEQWRARGFKIGFTNGCFDIIHSGHTHYLNEARANCDRLVVAINCDESVSRLKGKTRPINNEDCRAAVIGSLGAVDLVILFAKNASENDEPTDLLKVLKPDLLIKGGDYKNHNEVIGSDFVKSYGGEVMIASLLPQKSTTNIIEKAKEQ